MIHTSICIAAGQLEKIRLAAARLDKNEGDILSLLLHKSRKLFGNRANTGRAVRYQQDAGEGNFVIHHVCFSDSDYECATSRRYIFKFSVSFIFSLAVSFCLDEIIDEWTKDRPATQAKWTMFLTNSHLVCFDVEHLLSFDAEFWKIPWPRE